MQKIISVFQRNYDGNRQIRDEVVPGAEWVLAGEGVATRKFDGTCCMVRDGKLYKRYEVKKGGKAPAGFEPASEIDPVTQKVQGWLLVGDGPEDQWHRQAWVNQFGPEGRLADWTYELCGPKVQGNPEQEYVEREVGAPMHLLIPHGKCLYADTPRQFEPLKLWLAERNIEGVVFHHADGRMAKVKLRDYGLSRSKPAK